MVQFRSFSITVSNSKFEITVPSSSSSSSPIETSLISSSSSNLHHLRQRFAVVTPPLPAISDGNRTIHTPLRGDTSTTEQEVQGLMHTKDNGLSRLKKIKRCGGLQKGTPESRHGKVHESIIPKILLFRSIHTLQKQTQHGYFPDALADTYSDTCYLNI
ncbi:unnamed protein product [Camellia sinensis]